MQTQGPAAQGCALRRECKHRYWAAGSMIAAVVHMARSKTIQHARRASEGEKYENTMKCAPRLSVLMLRLS